MANNVYTVVSIEASKKLIKNFVDKIFTPEVEEADWQKKSDLLADNLYGLLYKIAKSVENPVDVKFDILELITLIFDPKNKFVFGIFIE